MGDTFLVIGLGNPGREYRETRHNIGFMLLDRLAVLMGARFSRLHSKALVADVIFQNHKVILAKPQTFMNLSGQAVRGLLRFYKLPLVNLLVAHDDLDLPLGSIRLRPDGGSAGQKGMTSILEYLGTDVFARLRLGIGRPPGHMEPQDYVLQNITDEEMTIVSDMLSRAATATQTWMDDGLDLAMSKFNVTIREP